MAKTVLITGASKGIGRETAVQFAREGYNVVVNYNRSKHGAQALLDELTELGCDAISIRADVANRAQVQAMVATATERFKHIDVLINNAGIAQQKLFGDITPHNWERMLGVNITGVFNTCQCVLPQMIRRQAGKIINVSSIWGISGASCEVHYSTSKAAVIGFTKALAKEVGPSHIQVNCVAPGIVSTEMNVHLDAQTLEELREETPLGTIGTPADIANVLSFLASKKADFITGQVISPNGGFVI
ncbi:3-oxoacyl-ACP reductase FabG [Oscillospiraceae bacterium PP1C4]